MTWTQHDIPTQQDRTAIVTGANSGIGFETAKALVEKGAHVVLACRNLDKGRAALAAILAEQPSGSAELMELDLSDLASVRAFADAFLSGHDRLDLLVNNAGVMVPPLGKTADGFELQFGTNHLGHFALTGLLLERLLATDDSRVVNVSSIAHRSGRIAFDNLDASKGYKPIGAYGQSKLANLLFTRELQRRLAEAGHTTLVTAAHPGWTATNLQDNVPASRFFNKLLAQEPADGALPTLFAATADAEPNGYYGPSRFFEMNGPPKAAKRSKAAQDDQVAQLLWKVSEELTGVQFGLA